MVESNKILTVSYGTFSCTLEGFDDSFSTMKAIAEYFRDLAAGDRYFGAEPATPDADMLARIAEREIARRVDARMESSGLVLRATGAIGLDTPQAHPEQAITPPVTADAAQRAHNAAQPTGRLSGKHDFQGSVPAATATADGNIDGPGVSLLAASGPPMPQAVERPPEAQRPGRTIRIAPAAPVKPDNDSIAAKLQRIRAVVGKASTGVIAPEVADYVEDLNDVMGHDDTQTPQTDAILSRFMAQDEAPAVAQDALPLIEDDLRADDLHEDAGLDMPPPETDDWDADFDMSAIRAVTAIAGMGADSLTARGETAMPEKLDDIGVADADLADGGKDDDDLADLDLSGSEPDDFVEDDDFEDGDVEEPAPAPIRARVIRMKRADFEQAVASGALEEVGPTADLPLDNVAALDGIDDLERFAGLAGDHRLTPADEDDLMQELAQVQREYAAAPDDQSAMQAQTDLEDGDLFGDDEVEGGPDADFGDDDFDAEEDEEEAAQLSRSARPGRAILDREPDADEAAMSRILSVTDAQLNEPESNRRRDAIAQLKAAVAATEAARRMGEPSDETEEVENAFRDDLSQVVRPRRASLSDHRSERPRPAPLKLVASQRIDLDAERTGSAAPVMPVRPRRVAVDAAPAPTLAAAVSGAESFTDFAENMGARELGELLEAAAAYTSFVEGLEDFSRPQLMKKVREAAGEDFSREDGLRSFGTLLRQGRIEKVSNGRFQVSEQTRYRPEPRAARG